MSDRSVPSAMPLAASLWPAQRLGSATMVAGMGIGAAKAWQVGNVPFIAATPLKNVLGVTLKPGARRVVDRRR